MALKILVCGDRNWTDRQMIHEELSGYDDWKIEVIHGGARGADRLAGDVARELGFSVRVFPADWDRFGKSAGPRRNIQMLEQEPDLVIAFHDDLANSRGTGHMVSIAEKAGVPVLRKSH